MHLIGPDPAKPRRQPVQVVLEKMEDSWALPHEDKGLVAFFAASCAATYFSDLLEAGSLCAHNSFSLTPPTPYIFDLDGLVPFSFLLLRQLDRCL